MKPKIKYWWSDNKQWFCIQIGDQTISLTSEEASLLSMNAAPPETKPDFFADVRTKTDLRDFKVGDLHLNRER